MSEKDVRLAELMKGFKPEFGNPHHLHILELSKKAGSKKILLKSSKAKKTQIDKLLKESTEAEDRLISALEHYHATRK